MKIPGTKVVIKATTKDAMDLFRKGNRVLAKMETNGIKIDVEYIRQQFKVINRQVEEKTKNLNKYKDVIVPWKRKYGKKMNFGSPDQIGDIFYNVLGYECKERTSTGKPKTSADALSKIDHPFIKDRNEIARLKKAKGTLKGIYREIDENGYLHTVFNLNLARTFRSTSDSPNFQNIQVRDPEMAKLVRKSFVSRFKNGRIVENDFKTLEVGIATCYHKDPTMLRHLLEGYDYHRNLASRLFCCKPEQVSKEARFEAKNKFVFAQFYGDYYVSCAKNLWERMDHLKVGEVPMKKWLKKKGIKKLGECDPKSKPKKGTFEYHVMKVENYFWDKEYPVYTKWRSNWYKQYQKTLKIPMYTGFVSQGVYRRNQVINFPVQGAAFHCLLWAACEIEKELRKRGMKTLLIGQIHDCLLADVPDDELQDYLNIVHHTISVKLPKKWDWIIVPMEVEAEVCPIGGSWYDKKPWVRKDKTWQLAA